MLPVGRIVHERTEVHPMMFRQPPQDPVRTDFVALVGRPRQAVAEEQYRLHFEPSYSIVVPELSAHFAG
jgi:hypothetical protein